MSDKQVEIWDMAYLSPKPVRDTMWDIYLKGQADLLMPYDVESIEELIENVERKAKKEVADSLEAELFHWEGKERMIDELTIYNLSIKYPNTVDLIREVEKMVRADAIDEFLEACDARAKYDMKKHPQNAYCIDRVTLLKIAEQLKEQNNES